MRTSPPNAPSPGPESKQLPLCVNKFRYPWSSIWYIWSSIRRWSLHSFMRGHAWTEGQSSDWFGQEHVLPKGTTSEDCFMSKLSETFPKREENVFLLHACVWRRWCVVHPDAKTLEGQLDASLKVCLRMMLAPWCPYTSLETKYCWEHMKKRPPTWLTVRNKCISSSTYEDVESHIITTSFIKI